MLHVRTCNPQASRGAEDPVIFTFVCDTRRWQQAFTEPTGGKKTKANPNGIKITRSFNAKIRSELSLKIPACRFQCKHWNVCERYARVYLGYWSCTRYGCATRVRVDGQRIGSRAIRFCAKYPKPSFTMDNYLRWSGMKPRKSCGTAEMPSKRLVNPRGKRDQGTQDELGETDWMDLPPHINGRSCQFCHEGTIRHEQGSIYKVRT